MKEWFRKAWANVKKNAPLIVQEFPYASGAIALVFLVIGVAIGVKIS